MAGATPTRFTLDLDGRRYELETDSSGWQTVARLFVDGQQAAERKGSGKSIEVAGGELTAVVRLNWLGQATEVLAVTAGIDPKKADEEGMAFAPPPGSRAARMEAFRREHPALYAARHVVLAAVQTVVGVLGFGALAWAFVQELLPRISVPWPTLPAIPWPEVDLPDVPWPDLPLPEIDVPELAFLGALKALWSSFNWLVPIVIAILVAINEVEKRRRRTSRQSEVDSGRSLD
jgi:hypothetical protein